MPTNGHALRFRRLFLAWTLLFPVAGCSLLGRPSPVPDRSQDARIQQEVRSRLQREPTLDAALLRVEVDASTVRLYGSVRGLAAWKCALRNADLVQGVTGVVDFLVLERGPRDAPCLAPARPATASDTRDREAAKDYIQARKRRNAPIS